MANKFLESVANLEAYSATTGVLIFTGLANISSTFNISMDTADVRAGQGNSLLYVYKHSRGIEVNVEQAVFDKSFLASNVGATIATAARDIYYSECLTFDGSGDADVTNTPVGSVYIVASTGTITTVTPTVKAINVPALADETVDVYYQYNLASVPRITIPAGETPDVIKLVLRAKIKDSSGAQVEELQITIPSFQISGDYELAFTADGVSSESITGSALEYASANCAGKIYGTFDYVPITASNDYTIIYASPSGISEAVGDLPVSQQITVYGLLGGLSQPVDVTTECTIEMRAGSDTDITVSTTGTDMGLVTIADTAVATDEGFVDISLVVGSNTITDAVHVLVTA